MGREIINEEDETFAMNKYRIKASILKLRFDYVDHPEVQIKNIIFMFYPDQLYNLNPISISA